MAANRRAWTSAAALALLLAGQVGPAAQGAPGDFAACSQESATIVGTEDDDVLVGTPGDDVIWSDGGNDVVDGGEGNDLLCAGRGDDLLLARIHR